MKVNYLYRSRPVMYVLLLLVYVILYSPVNYGHASTVITGAELQNNTAAYPNRRIYVTPILIEMGDIGDISLTAYAGQNLEIGARICTDKGNGPFFGYLGRTGLGRTRIVRGDTLSTASQRLYQLAGGSRKTTGTNAYQDSTFCTTNGAICPLVVENLSSNSVRWFTEACRSVSESVVSCETPPALVLDHGIVQPGATSQISGQIPVSCDGSATVQGYFMNNNVSLGNGVVSELRSTPSTLQDNGTFNITSTMNIPLSTPAGPMSGGTVFIVDVK